MGSHDEHKHDPFSKRVSRVDPNMTRIRLASTHDLFINGLVVSGSQIVSDCATPSKQRHLHLSFLICSKSLVWNFKPFVT